MPIDFLKDGKELFEQKKYKKAYNQLKKATKQNPESHPAWFFKAKALYKYNHGSDKRKDFKKYEEANNDIDKALELNPENAEAWITKSRILLNIGTYEDSLKCCNEALRIKLEFRKD